MNMTSWLRNETGAVGVIVAVVLVVLLMVMALVVDVGQAYQVKRQLQTAADAASLAGAYDLAQGASQSTAGATAQSYAQKNSSQPFDSLQVTFPTPATIKVAVRQSKATFFASLFGVNAVQVGASATAGGSLVTTVNSGVVPIIVPFQQISGHVGSGNPFTFNLGSDNSQAGQGFFWLINFSNSEAGTPDYADWIEQGYPNPVSIGDTASGNGMKAALKEALQQRMSSQPKLIVPLYDLAEAAGDSKTYHVVGFAEFVITGFNLNGNPKTISGYFTTGDLVNGLAGGGGTPKNYGIVVISLTQ